MNALEIVATCLLPAFWTFYLYVRRDTDAVEAFFAALFWPLTLTYYAATRPTREEQRAAEQQRNTERAVAEAKALREREQLLGLLPADDLDACPPHPKEEPHESHPAA